MAAFEVTEHGLTGLPVDERAARGCMTGYTEITTKATLRAAVYQCETSVLPTIQQQTLMPAELSSVRALSEDEIKESLAAFGPLGHDRVHFDGRGLFFSHAEVDCSDLRYPRIWSVCRSSLGSSPVSTIGS
jgi:hypothetical protein